MRHQRVGAVVVAATVVLAVVGCTSPTKKSATPTTGSQAVDTTSTIVGVPVASVRVATNPRLGVILVDDGGLTVYAMAAEKSGNIVCTGDCAKTWPPLLLDDGADPIAGAGVTGTLTVVNRPDGGRQVVYDGRPLYHYSDDANPGDTNGQGVGGVWSVISVPAGLGADSSTSSST